MSVSAFLFTDGLCAVDLAVGLAAGLFADSVLITGLGAAALVARLGAHGVFADLLAVLGLADVVCAWVLVVTGGRLDDAFAVRGTWSRSADLHRAAVDLAGAPAVLHAAGAVFIAAADAIAAAALQCFVGASRLGVAAVYGAVISVVAALRCAHTSAGLGAAVV